MRRTGLTALLLCLCLSPAQATGIDVPGVVFHSPAQAGPDVDAAGPGWLLVVFGSGAASGTVDFPGPATAQVFTEANGDVEQEGVADLRVPLPSVAEPKQGLDVRTVDVAFAPQAPASLYVEATGLAWGVRGAGGEIAWKDARDCLDAQAAQERLAERAARYEALCAGESAALTSRSSTGFPFALKATGVSVVEWHNARVSCPSQAGCPSGGIRQEHVQRNGANATAIRRLGFERLETSEATLALDGLAALAVGGGPSLDVAVRGEVRLPLATAVQACADCLAPDGQTLRLAGDVNLQRVEPAGQGMLSSDVSGDVSRAALDEWSFDPARLASALWVGGAVGAVAAAAWGLAWLFTRHEPQRGLAHPRRQLILDYVRANPGVKLRQAMFGTGVPSGTFRHHLARLVAHGHVVRRRLGGAVRLYENHGRHDSDWKTVALLRDEAASSIHAWLRANPGASRAQLLAATAPRGWSRSKVEKRLMRLMQAGLVVARRDGRTAHYQAQ